MTEPEGPVVNAPQRIHDIAADGFFGVIDHHFFVDRLARQSIVFPIGRLIPSQGIGYLVNSRPVDWTQAIDVIYKDIDAYRRMSANCLITAGQYSWGRRAEDIYRFFQQEPVKSQMK